MYAYQPQQVFLVGQPTLRNLVNLRGSWLSKAAPVEVVEDLQTVPTEDAVVVVIDDSVPVTEEPVDTTEHTVQVDDGDDTTDPCVVTHDAYADQEAHIFGGNGCIKTDHLYAA